MSSGNHNSYDYGEPYRNYPPRPTREDLHQRRAPVDQSLGPRGYPFPPGNPYPPTYGQLPTNLHNPPPPLFNRSAPPPMPPRFGFDRFPPPGTAYPDWNTLASAGALTSTTYNGYNNNNNNYPNQANNWTPYQQSPWRLDAPAANVVAFSQPPVPDQSSSTYLPPPKPPSPEPVPAVVAEPKRSDPTETANDEKDEEKDIKKPVPIMVGKRRGGKVLPTGIVKKPRTGSSTQGRTDAWGQYMAEVKKYKEQSCEEERKNRPLVK